MGESHRVLLIAAHPDDEDTALLAYLSRALGVNVAYLALTRGDGGQNLIGEELGVPLGILRSQELAAARHIDGGRQFFTRAYDFGYTRSLEETERFWPPDSVLKDVVRIIRRFRPQVIVSVFSGTPRDGHGQHQMSGVMAQQAFDAAGDPARFPELQREEGLLPWTPLKLYRSTRFDQSMTSVTVPVGDLDPRNGKTYFQIAMESRSQHRSQSFGVLQVTGPREGRIGLMQSRVPGPDTDIFSGIPGDSSWLVALADSLRGALRVSTPGALVPGLEAARARFDAEGGPGRQSRLLAEGLAIAQGLVLDAVASDEQVVPGDSFRVEVTLYNAGQRDVTLQGLALVGPASWGLGNVVSESVTIHAGDAYNRRVAVVVPRDAQTTQPYFVERPLNGAMYDWSAAAPQLRGEPFDPPLVQVAATVAVGRARIPLTREVSYRFADQASGEVRRPVRVVPAVEVRLEPGHLVWSSGSSGGQAFRVTLQSDGSRPVSGRVSLAIDGWPAPPAQAFHLEHHGETSTLTFRVRRPASFTRGAVEVRAVARTADGRRYDAAVNLVDYPHVRPTPYVVHAVSEVNVAPITLPRLHAIGYVRGASDKVPETLTSLGLPVTLLDGEALARGDLSPFDAIVIGARAYETDSALVRNNDRLLAYVQNGGYLLVQYQQYQFVNGHFAPYPLTINRPHDRITDETAPVRILVPDSPVFHRPHEIGPQDWEGWPQERGLYFAGTWDDHYTPLLEMQDPGMAPVKGGLLVAHPGKGTYVYTGISFFRSLPGGNAGAVRLFLNLLALGQQ